MRPKKLLQDQWCVDLDLRKIGRILKSAREQLRCSYRELASRCGISATQLLRMESGEFEFSVVKFNAVCVALGVPASDLLEYASTRKTASRHVYEDDPWLATHVGFIDARLESDQPGRLLSFLDACYELAVVILTAGNPQSCAARIIPPPGMSVSPCFLAFADTVSGFSNVERVATLEALRASPYYKLKSLGLIPVGDLKTYIHGTGEWQPRVRPPDSILAITQAADSTKGLQHVTASAKFSGVKAKPRLPGLLEELRKATKERGMKSALAEFLGVPLANVSQWLAGVREPGGEYVLQMEAWLELPESKRKDK